MDARYRRSRDALREAVYRLASRRPVEDLTVSEICRAAGITRDTFYRHGSSPVDVLTQLLAEELDAQLEPDPDRPLDRAGFRRSERALLGHVAKHADIYRLAAQPALVASLRSNLERVISAHLLEYVRRFPDTIPDELGRDPEASRVVVAYAASGTVGAIEAWLAGPDLDVDRGARLIVAASPSFWFADD